MQAYLEGEGDELVLATFAIVRFDPEAHSPPEGTDIVSYLEDHFPDLPGEIPSEPNTVLDGIAAARVYNPESPQAPSYEEIYFIQNGKLFVIRMIDVDSHANRDLYDNMISTMSFE